MLVDLVVKGKDALVVGGGREAEFKIRKLIEGEAKVTVVAGAFTKALREMALEGKIDLTKVRKVEDGNVASLLDKLNPCVVFVATGDFSLDEEVAALARSRRAIVYVVDTPWLNDINMPAVAAVGEIRVAVSTGGRSPAMASLIRKRIEKLITREDVLQVRLQGSIRRESRKHLRDPSARRMFVYSLLKDRRIISLLKDERYREAKDVAMKMLRKAG